MYVYMQTSSSARRSLAPSAASEARSLCSASERAYGIFLYLYNIYINLYISMFIHL